MFFSVYTLGCKLNQLESEAIADSFCRGGVSFLGRLSPGSKPGGTAPDLVVVNTCTVTSMADQKGRRIIRKLLRDYPRACVIVTGCYAQMEKAALSALEEDGGKRLFVIPGQTKDRIMDLPRFLAGAEQGFLSLPELIGSWLSASGLAEETDGAFRFSPERFSSHSRSFLKIQDGCDHSCAYCRVSLARGKSRSLGAREILRRLIALEEQGYAEAVLTGVNITQYRDPEQGLPALSALLDFLLRETGTIRLRLSSIEPDLFAAESGAGAFFRAVENQRIRPHFHFSLQSGSAAIITRMGRSYTPEGVEKTIKTIRSIRRDPFLACDIIAGFPGETEREFDKTMELCEKSDFSWIHAFPFSPRPGTAACHFDGKVSERDAVKRVELLTDLARRGRRAYLRRWEEKEVEAIAEVSVPGKAPQDGYFPALSENYLKLLVHSGENPVPAPGALLKCRILRGEEPSRIASQATAHYDALAEKTG